MVTAMERTSSSSSTTRTVAETRLIGGVCLPGGAFANPSKERVAHRSQQALELGRRVVPAEAALAFEAGAVLLAPQLVIGEKPDCGVDEPLSRRRDEPGPSVDDAFRHRADRLDDAGHAYRL